MTPQKIKAPEGIKPNAEVIVDKRHQEWETRWWDEETEWVYALHKGYLWPQRTSDQYYKFRLLKHDTVFSQVFQDFVNYQELGTRVVPKVELKDSPYKGKFASYNPK